MITAESSTATDPCVHEGHNGQHGHNEKNDNIFSDIDERQDIRKNVLKDVFGCDVSNPSLGRGRNYGDRHRDIHLDDRHRDIHVDKRENKDRNLGFDANEKSVDEVTASIHNKTKLNMPFGFKPMTVGKDEEESNTLENRLLGLPGGLHLDARTTSHYFGEQARDEFFDR